MITDAFVAGIADRTAAMRRKQADESPIRPEPKRERTVVALLMVCMLVALQSATAAPLSPEQRRGKSIYATGTTERGAVIGTVIAGGVKLEASMNPCVQCHGRDGRGGFDGGVTTPEIRWSRLTAPYGVPTTLRGVRPSYSEETLRRAIREGLDSAGDPLDHLMPRYAFLDEDIADLTAYLRAIGSESAPGTTPHTVRIGTLLPLSGPLASQGRAIGSLLRHAFARINEAGGIHGRQLELVEFDASDAPETLLAAASHLLQGPEEVFCFIANAGAGTSPELIRQLEALDIPVLGPLTFASGTPTNGSVFYLLASLEDEARAAARFLARGLHGNENSIGVLQGSTLSQRAMASAFEREARERGLSIVASEELGAVTGREQIRRLRASGAKLMALFGDTRGAREWLDRASELGWRPTILASTVLLAGPPPEADNLLLISPAVAPGTADRAVEDFESLRLQSQSSMEGSQHAPSGATRPRAAPRSGADRAMEMTAYASARLLFEALKSVGRELDREQLRLALRDVRNFETGVMPPIRFGPNRRVGVRGAILFSRDGEGRTLAADWIGLDDDAF